MALGYIMSVQDVMAYYGPQRPEVARALARAAGGRAVQLTDWPPGLDTKARGELELTGDPQALAEHVRRRLDETMPGALPHQVPPRYPGLHATVGRDLVLEVDAKQDRREAFEGGRRIMEFLDRHGAPYRVKFSGNSSSHVIIPRAAYETLIPEEQRSALSRRLYAWVVEHCGVAVDGSFGGEYHFLRLPYSLNERTGLVSLPLRPEEYDDFELEMAEAPRVRVEEWWFATEDLLARREGMLRLLREALGPDAP
jgi:hypothetical protein